MMSNGQPEIDNSVSDPVVGELVEDLANRLQAGEPVDIDVYLREHPAQAERVRRLLPAVRALAELGSAAGSRDDPASPPGADRERVSGLLGDYRIVREVGRGGMGVVYEAEQVSLGRRVALKMLPLAAALDSRHLQRFHNEARAAAGLHHSNIVPVYGVGSERGIHYYAMQFIDGQTLASLIAQLRRSATRPVAPTGAATDPYLPRSGAGAPDGESETPLAAALSTERAGRGREYFRTVAHWGVQAAEALDYAHQLGVVHRDIKPGNLLVEGRDQLWVTDFGLARIQSEASLTTTGDLIGTLRYMSPEQALAKRIPIDHRTDVYSLGATLYELLTLAPAFGGSDRQELLRQIAFEEPVPPRRLNRAVPGELETIVLKALEKGPQDRYATAQEMADDLERLLKDEPIRARKPPLWLRLRKWGRRHRALVASLVAGVLLLLVVGVVMAFAYQRRLAETERRVTAALVQVETLVDEGDKLIDHPERWHATARLALAALEKAEELLATGAATGSLTRRVEKARATVEAAMADSGLLIELDRIRLEQATARRGRFGVGASASAYAKALGTYGVGLEAPESAGERIRNSRLREWLLAALEDWWQVCDDDGASQQLERVLEAADPTNVVRPRWREAAGRQDGAALVKMAVDLATQRLPPVLVCCRAADLTSLNQWAAAERLLKAALARDPGDFWLNHDMGMVIQEQGPARAEEAVGYLRAALALRSDSPAVYLHMGLALEDKGDLDGAIDCCRAALDIDPKDADAHNNLCLLLVSKGRLDEAVSCCQRAIASDPKDAYAHNNLGIALWAGERRDEAIACFQRAIDIDPKFYDALANLGPRLLIMGRIEEAIGCLKRAIAVEPNRDPRKCALTHNNLGYILNDKLKDHAGAIAEFRTTIALNPGDAHYHHNLGNALGASGQLDGAIAQYQEAVRLNKDYAEPHCELGLILERKGRFADALAELKRGHELGSRQPGWNFPSADWVRNAERLADLDARLPEFLEGKARPADVAERLALASLCRQHRKLFAAATRWYAEAFAAWPTTCPPAAATTPPAPPRSPAAARARTRTSSIRKSALACVSRHSIGLGLI
jgi:serine/threonine protein kinase/Tfp pilus assembly protein PilF